MKKLFLTLGLILALAIPAYAQWGGFIETGATTATHNIDVLDAWWHTNTSGVTSSSIGAKGFEKVRADFDVTGSDVSIVYNFQCSNDTIWVSGDSTTVTEDSWVAFDVMGCEDVNIYLEGISASDSIKIYLTPFNTAK